MTGAPPWRADERGCVTMISLFTAHLEAARRADGSIDLAVLEQQIVAACHVAAEDRLRSEATLAEKIGELGALKDRLRAEIARNGKALRESRKAARAQTAHLRAALDHMAQGLALFDRDQRLVTCNRQYLELYGLPRRLARPGTTFEQLLRGRIVSNTWSGEDEEAWVECILDVARANEPSNSVVATNDGRRISVSHQPLPDGGWVSTHMDVTERYRLEQQLAHLAYFDPLTDLPNRNMLLERISAAFADGAGEGFALLFLDLRGFKAINDTLGHALGDALLRGVAERLQASIPEGDFAGRLSGDEFAILVRGGDRASVQATAETIQNALRPRYELAVQPISLLTSMGIAVAPGDAANAPELLRRADLALHTAKREAPEGIRFFEPAMEQRLTERRRVEAEIGRALERGEFELHYQPVLNLARQRFSGFEALLRWRHPVRGLVAPGDFVPLAEELGLIVPIGEWVIREALMEASRWPSDLRVAVNVSSIQLERGNVVPVVTNALARSGLAPHRVEIEITESVFLAHNPQNLEALHQLHMLGVRVALDDFGTGYSALSYLLSFPFHKIKIDGSFVRALDNAEGAHAILGAVSEIGSRMGMTTTAEGVETAEQLRKVRDLGYTEAQGFLIARPLQRGALRQMLADSDAMPDVPFADAPEGAEATLRRRANSSR